MRWGRIVVALSSLVTMTGCLSLGGKTTYVHEKPETAGRLTALETRVSALERAMQLPTSAEPVAPIITE
jgi:hypothetical protein